MSHARLYVWYALGWTVAFVLGWLARGAWYAWHGALVIYGTP